MSETLLPGQVDDPTVGGWRRAAVVRGAAEILAGEKDGLAMRDLFSRLEARLPLSEVQLEPVPTRPDYKRFALDLAFTTTAEVTAGWLVKGGGHWTLTDSGRAALARFEDPTEFHDEATRIYRQVMTSREVSDASDYRDSAEYAARVMERLFPDEEVRQACAAILAETLKQVADYDSEIWMITLQDRAITLNIGRWAIVSYGRQEQEIHLAIDVSVIEPKVRSDIETLGAQISSQGFKALLGVTWITVPPAQLETIWGLVKSNFSHSVTRAAQGTKRTPYLSKHAPGVVDYLNQELGENIVGPQPGGARGYAAPRSVWIFQANPRLYDLDKRLAEVSVGDEDDWTVSRYRSKIKPGDLMILWQGGDKAGIRALAGITGKPVLKPAPEYTSGAQEWGARFRYTHILKQPMLKETLRTDPVLGEMLVVRFPQGTNFRGAAAEWTALQRLLRHEGVDVSESEAEEGDRWDAFVRWGTRFSAEPTYGANEREYKLTIAGRLREARAALEDSEDWWPVIRKAFGSPNNLTPWRLNDDFLKWLKADPDAGKVALRAAWEAGADVSQRIRAIVAALPAEVATGRGTRLALASFLQLAMDEHQWPVYRWTPASTAYRLTGNDGPAKGDDEADVYVHFVDFLDTFIEEAANRGLAIVDRLDAQGLVWGVTSLEPEPTWPLEEQQAFLRFRSGGAVTASNELGVMVETFLDQSGYPTERDLQRRRERGELALALVPEALDEPNVQLLRRLAGPAYEYPGPQPAFMTVVATEDGPARISAVIKHLLYGPGDVEHRVEEALTGPLSISGMKEALLTIADPENWIPVYIAGGDKGKRRMLERLQLEVPTATLPGQLAVATNEALRQALEPYFDLDTYGMKEFLYWALHADKVAAQEDSLATLASDLFVDVDQLTRIERLLRDKGQVIFFGPPGTGTTFIARELAKYFSRSGAMGKVQFHPSYSYEDFVEGYRPRVIEGQPGFFDLVDGPLKDIARQAQADPAGQYVLLIDEINRGNVAKIFGELYFLLEYRDEEISLQYSKEPFSLPRNLWIIGTMNTADRSIALVDAALRRRFHFVPFFPDEPPIAGLLRRWLDAKLPALAWVADLVDLANERLDNRHMAIGPSHFLRKDLTEEWVELIWEHSVLPYVAEQFFGEEGRLKDFALADLRRALDAPSGESTVPIEPGDEEPDAD